MGFRVTLTGRPIFANRPMGACGCTHPGLRYLYDEHDDEQGERDATGRIAPNSQAR